MRMGHSAWGIAHGEDSQLLPHRPLPLARRNAHVLNLLVMARIEISEKKAWDKTRPPASFVHTILSEEYKSLGVAPVAPLRHLALCVGSPAVTPTLSPWATFILSGKKHIKNCMVRVREISC